MEEAEDVFDVEEKEQHFTQPEWYDLAKLITLLSTAG